MAHSFDERLIKENLPPERRLRHLNNNPTLPCAAKAGHPMRRGLSI
jgi:hypothetical protein